ncbi:MAG: ferredoxin--NADP reductase [Microscillaceae bacterium]|jgi:ring-1,2-phenylacetyl-CoA epoxidase subunit PaaE|nr:ferredoxin--NADP reductase [Microscillaceae bacterium]
MNHLYLKIRNITKETAEAITVEFENPDNEPISYQAGQFLTLIVNIKGESVRRAYSLCTSPLIHQHPAVTIKRIKGGLVSNYLNDTLKVGDTVEVLPPMGVFTTEFSENNRRHLVLFGGGSGITPLMSLLLTTLQSEPKSMVSLIYANRDADSIIFKKKIEDLQIQFKDRFNLVQIWEKTPLFWSKGHKGLLNTKMIRKILDSLPKSTAEATEYFMCGPNPMMEVIQKAFIELKLPLDKLRKESFGISPEEAATKKASILEESQKNNVPTEGYEVTVRYDGEEHKFMVPPDKSILQTALALDIDLPYSCQSGMCTACMGKCVAGKVKLDEEDALTPKELDQGYVLTCVGHPMSEGVVIVID